MVKSKGKEPASGGVDKGGWPKNYRPPCEVYVNVEFIPGDPITVNGGTVLQNYWYRDENLTFEDIAKRVRDMGYPEVSRVGYYKPEGDWHTVTMVKDDGGISQLFDEGYAFGFVKLFIECNSQEEFEHFDRDETVTDAILNYEADMEAETSADLEVGNQEGNGEMEADEERDESDFTFICNPEEDTDDDSVSEGGTDFDEEYRNARVKKKNSRISDFDRINGLGLDGMLDAPGGVCSHNGKYWEGGASGNLDAHKDIQDKESDDGSDYADTDDGLLTPCSSDEDDLEIRKKKRASRVYYNPACDHEKLEWEMDMIFINKMQVKNAVQQWAICRGHDVTWRKSERLRVEARCKAGCPWRFYASRKNSCTSFQIMGLQTRHACQRATRNRQATSDWLAKEFIKKFRREPGYSAPYMQLDIKDKYKGLIVSLSSCYRARTTALDVIRGSLESHYANFRAYDAELKRIDKEGLFQFYLINDPKNGAPIFQRYYVGFSGLRKGFNKGCRPVLCVDGCFLKTLIGGCLLSAVGRDGNNQMFPVAWAIAEAENEETWTWFMELLISDLGFGDGVNLTLISDQQKGLKNAITNVVPFAEHRNCARHIYANWKKKHKDPELKRIFWYAVNATNLPEFDSHMKTMKSEKPAAFDDFMGQVQNVFCKAFIRPHAKCDAITSNLVETFNGYIAKARQLHPIHMLEEIRTSLMARMYQKSELMEKHFEDICPRIRERIDRNQISTRLCDPIPAKGGAFQVSCDNDQFIVCLKTKSCSCRAWDISGIPCAHALACINFMRFDVCDYVDGWYKKEKYQEAYRFSLQPINGINMWPNVEGFDILPPPYKKLPGRPKKNRRKDPDEEPKKNPRYARKGVAMTCQHCLNEGHNKRACPNKDQAPVDRPAKRAKGRPRGAKWVDKTPTSQASGSNPSSTKMKKQRREQLLQSRITAQRNASTPAQRNEVQREMQSQVIQTHGIKINTRSGFIYSQPATADGVRYVSGAVATASAARASNKPATSSQQGSTATQEPRPPKSVVYKSTASQAATPRIDKLPIIKGKKKA
ncbi:uncharacterized protein LOC126677837 [Mercurialis annua]|uniref:uncharacterized protein LOC126654939 n=1 Tax=Mercurialis annua TaxID=3986 RepID=UPI00215FFAB7|nr:uncharacterized protein LOC126654939 [Mercurialis annua]XP_050228599.1 uncharacterized protein LOC126677837 [Mercurialis annua]XP_050228606.1 uncharacterized protein LOC126677837 [Mercurialis annua]